SDGVLHLGRDAAAERSHRAAGRAASIRAAVRAKAAGYPVWVTSRPNRAGPAPYPASYARFHSALAVPSPADGMRSIISANVAFWTMPNPIPNRLMPASTAAGEAGQIMVIMPTDAIASPGPSSRA